MEEREPDLPARSVSGTFAVSTSVDVTALVGAYPFRAVPHPDVKHLLSVLDREGIARAWVGSLPAAFHRDPRAANAALYGELGQHRDRLDPAPAIRPDWPGWEAEFDRALGERPGAIRAWPSQWGLGPGDRALESLAAACAASSLPLVLTVRLEDARQRHRLDVAGDLPAATIRELARAGTGARLVVVAGGRQLVEEVHWGLSPGERSHVWYDISWIWGPPEDDLAHLLRTIGPQRFIYGSCWPMRLAQVPRANLELLPPDVAGVSLADPATWSGGRGAG